MNIEEIDKWLNNEYGVSYTSLEEIHDWLVDENMKKDKEIERLRNELAKIPRAKMEYDLEIERLNNIINELERHLEQQWLEWKDCETDVRFMANEDKCILEKLRELKGEQK